MTTPTIKSRKEWGAAPPKRTPYKIAPTKRLWLHHFASEHHGVDGMRQIQRFHQVTKGWNDFAYNFAVDNDGTIYEGRGALIAGGHTAGDNTTSQAIVIMGNTHARDVTPAQRASIAWLVRHGHEQGWWPEKITGSHRDAQRAGFSPSNGTACAGDYAQRRLAEINEMAVGKVAPAPSPEENDLYGTEIIASYVEAGYPLSKQIGKDIRVWTHEIYSKPEAERRGGIQWIRALLGLKD